MSTCKDAPLYSPWLAKRLHLREPPAQYVFYGTTLTGGGILVNRFHKAWAQAKHVEAKSAHEPAQTVQHWALTANVASHRLEHATWLIARFRAEGILAAAGMPLL